MHPPRQPLSLHIGPNGVLKPFSRSSLPSLACPAFPPSQIRSSLLLRCCCCTARLRWPAPFPCPQEAPHPCTPRCPFARTTSPSLLLRLLPPHTQSQSTPCKHRRPHASPGHITWHVCALTCWAGRWTRWSRCARAGSGRRRGAGRASPRAPHAAWPAGHAPGSVCEKESV